jgi:superoxide dismutase, Cu-Zn family
MKLSVPFSILAAASATALFAAPPTRAVAVLHPTTGNAVEGQVTFTKADGGVKVSAHITGLTPGKHGFHIHEYGDCTAPDGTSAGGHFNPEGNPHGAPTDAKRHEGDLGNVEANDQGVADLEYVDTHASFEGESSILGRGVIVHAGADDLKTQPTGNAGGRVACGVIGAAKSQ